MSSRLSSLSWSKPGSIALLLACSACPGDDTPSHGDSGSSTTDATTGITTLEPDSTSRGEESTTTEAMTTDVTVTESTTAEPMTTTTDATVTGTTTGGPMCGDGTAEGDESCDTDDLAGEDCVSQGFSGGSLLCNKDCTFDTSQCTSDVCGNDTTEGAEVCDGTDLSGQSCQTQGFSMGTLGCAADCTAFDTSGCSNPMCGNDVIEMGEVCDGTALAGQTCVTQGFPAGTLACLGDCSGYDTSGCSCVEQDIGGAMGPAVASGNTGGDDNDIDAMCGGAGGNDHIIQFTAPFAGDFQFDLQGSDYDTKLALYSDCATEIACNDDSFGTLQSALQLNMAAGQTVLIVVDGFNGGTGNWVLNIGPPAVCGDGAVTVPEACDGANLNGQDCTAFGFTAGALVCAPDCTGFDTSGCFNGPACTDQDIGTVTGAAVAGGNTGGDDDDVAATCGGASGNDHVMLWTATGAGQYTFDTFGSTYDTKLSLLSDCATEIACNDDTGGVQSQLVANLGAGQQILIAVDGFNGSIGDWVLNITAPVVAFPCQDQDLGSVIGNGVAGGNTGGDDNDIDPACGGGGGLDHVMRWVAPNAGSFTFNTFGSGYDTKLALYSDCATQLVCNDDTGGLQSQVQRNMAAGEVVLIVVDGFNGATGNWTLNITSP